MTANAIVTRNVLQAVDKSAIVVLNGVEEVCKMTKYDDLASIEIGVQRLPLRNVSVPMTEPQIARTKELAKLLHTSISAILRSGIAVAELKVRELEAQKE